MPNTTKNKIAGKKKSAADKAGKDYVNDPFFIKKREAASRILKKSGLPTSFTKKA